MGEVIEREQTAEEKAEQDAWAAATYEREYAQVEQQRQQAYQSESDPLFFKWQRNAGTEQEWLDKITEIDERYPYPVKPEPEPTPEPEPEVTEPEVITEPEPELPQE